ncbi:MAG: hypothetical protein LUE09_06230 [Synergistaceae bacterium]|nr:hypothetical protein [Synergistaceae bacterium]
MTDDAPEYADYKKAFDARHKKTGYKANIYAYYGMDGIMLLEWAVKKTKSFDGEVLKKALESAKKRMCLCLRSRSPLIRRPIIL